MYKYAVVNFENLVIDIITVSDMHTLDGYQLPEGQCALIDIRERLALIGQTYNHELDKFE
jgi:hypothetical protein